MPKPLVVVPDLEAELDALYALAPADFVDARDDLAQRLKQAGRTDAAGQVKGLRKPTVPVWAVNQLARARPREIQALLAAGARLRSAQERALAGGGDELRAATGEERAALRVLTQQADALLSAEGHGTGAATLERVASTLRAAATDPAGRDLLPAGRLTKELSGSGFGALAGMKIPASARRSTAKEAERGPTPAQRQATLRRLRDKSRRLDAEAKEAERSARSAEAAAAKARRKADQAAVAAEAARAALEEAEGATRP